MLNYKERNWWTFPVNENKEPLCKWKEESVLGGIYDRTGIYCGKSNLVVVDVDTKDGKVGDKTWTKLTKEYGIDDTTYVVMTESGGLHYYYSYDGDDIGPSQDILGKDVDIRAGAGYVVAPPTKKYEYISGEVIPLPETLAKLLRKQTKFLSDHREPQEGDVDRARKALGRLDSSYCDVYDSWVKVGMSLQDLGDIGLTLWDEWSKGLKTKYEVGKCAEKWPTFKRHDGISLGSLFYWAGPEKQEETKPTKKVEDVLISGADIFDAEIPDIDYLVEQILPPGLCFLAGKAKIGKSCAALQLAKAIITGDFFLGYKCRKGKVLYLALEDGVRRLKSRMKQQGWDREASKGVTFMLLPGFRAALGGRIDDKSWPIIERWVEEYDLIIIDTFSRAFPGDQYRPEDMTFILNSIQGYVINNDKTALIIDHHHKGIVENPDPVIDILGSTAKGAMADTTWGIYKDKRKKEGTFYVVSREGESIDFAIEWAGIQWVRTDIKEVWREIIKYISESGPAGVTEISKGLARDKGNLFREIQEMHKLGHLEKDNKKRYCIPNKDKFTGPSLLL